MRSCENESDSDIAVYTHNADKRNIVTHCASPLTSYFFLSLLTNAIRYSAPFGLPLSCCAIRTPPTDTATHPLPLSVLPARLDFNSQWKTDTPTPSAPCFSMGLTGSARRCAKYHRHSRIQGHAKQNEETARMNAVEEKRRRL